MERPVLLILGASARAAAFSALRAGLRPWALDLFADRDICAACPTRAIPPVQYPDGLAELARETPAGPWLYTGGLENHPRLVRRLARRCPLWGNDADVLELIRDPFAVADALHAADVPGPRVSTEPPSPPGRWLEKPLRSAGGAGIRFSGGRRKAGRPVYWQKFIAGEPRSAIFVADVHHCRLLGVTRQLVGTDWLHAAPFRYCGSVGPLELSAAERGAWQRLGDVLTQFAGLRGLFGVDAVLRDGVPWPVEVNPRYTASVEVLEYATGLRALALHRRVFDPAAPAAPEPRQTGCVGKAVYYAPRALIVPARGPWDDVLRQPPAVEALPDYADIPPAGQQVARGRPVMTLLTAGVSPADCEMRLCERAAALDRWLLQGRA